MRWRHRPHDRPLAPPAGHPHGPCRIHVPRFRSVNVTAGLRNPHMPSPWGVGSGAQAASGTRGLWSASWSGLRSPRPWPSAQGGAAPGRVVLLRVYGCPPEPVQRFDGPGPPRPAAGSDRTPYRYLYFYRSAPPRVRAWTPAASRARLSR
jgi:hypothetical protein